MKIKRIITILCAAVMTLCGINFTAFAETTEEEPKLIALTFDDGPNTYTTPKVLDLLEQYNAHASFFLIGDKINDESAVVMKRAYDMGCEIDSHSKTHSDMSEMTAEEIKAEMDYVNEYVYSVIGEYPKFFRPPYLNTSQTMYDAIDLPFICGYSSGDSNSEKTAEERAETVLSYAKDGAIILMHDFYGNDQTVEALKIILPELQSQGYEFVTLTELFERNEETPNHELFYYEVTKYPCDNYVFSENLFTGVASGDKDWSGWGSTILLDGEQLAALGDTYAIEVEYESTQPPVIVLHRWKSSDDTMWEPVQPAYYNGKTACFLAEDILSALDEYGMTYSDMTKIMLRTFITEMTITNADLLVKNNTASRMGDVNLDGKFNIADVVALQNYLLNAQEQELSEWQNGDFCNDNLLDSFDLCAMKTELSITGGI